MDRAIKLTPRGQQVAEMVALGLTNREIAKRIFVSERTVEWHVEQILNRLGFTSRSEIAAWIGRTQTQAAVRVPGSKPKGNLPAPLTSFIGREGELTALKGLMTANRLLTIVGSGGIGKTRLALRLAEKLEPEYPDGAWLCDLAPLANSALIGDAVAQAFGLSEESMDRLEAARKHLSERYTLLVLDNCEHMLSEAADVAPHLLGACRGLRILATSLEPLGVLGESVWRLDPLPESDAIRLFAERAEAAAPGFHMDDGTRAHVKTICGRLDGLPLALELAAPRLRLLSVAELADAVHDSISPRRSGDRHGSLDALAEWGYRTLREDERGLFRRLGLFAGWFEGDDAASIAPTEARVSMLVASLVEKSMLVANRTARGRSRYRLLETLRTFARTRLTETDEVAQVQLLHAERMILLAELAALGSGEAGPWLGPKLAEMVDDVRAALACLLELSPHRAARLAAALYGFWHQSGRLSEGLRWTTAALAAYTVASLERCWLLYRHANLLLAQDRRADASLALAEANSIAGLPECAEMRPYLLVWRGDVEGALGDRRKADALFREAIEEFIRTGKEYASTRALNELAMSLLYQERYEEARKLAERSVVLQRRFPAPLPSALDTLAQAHALLGDLDRARACWWRRLSWRMRRM